MIFANLSTKEIIIVDYKSQSKSGLTEQIHI